MEQERILRVEWPKKYEETEVYVIATFFSDSPIPLSYDAKKKIFSGNVKITKDINFISFLVDGTLKHSQYLPMVKRSLLNNPHLPNTDIVNILYSIKEKSKFQIKNQLGVDMSNRRTTHDSGHWINEGSQTIKAGDTSSFEGQSDFLGGLFIQVKYDFFIQGNKYTISVSSNGTLATSPNLMASITPKNNVVKWSKKKDRTIIVEMMCQEGYHWDSEVEACVKDRPKLAFEPLLKQEELLNLQNKTNIKDLMTSTTGQIVGQIIKFGTGKIPVVGSLVSGIIGVLWPSKTTTPEELWNNIKDYATELVKLKINEEKEENLRKNLQGLFAEYNNFEHSENERRAQMFASYFQDLTGLEPFFTDESNPASAMQYTVQMGTLYITTIKQYLEDKTIFTTPLTEDERKEMIKKLKTKVDLLSKYVADFIEEQIITRKNKITSDKNVIIDSEDNIKWEVNSISKAEKAKNHARDLAEYKQRIILDVYYDVSRTWIQFKPEKNVKDIPQRQNYMYVVGTPASVNADYWNDVSKSWIWEIVIRHGDRIDGIRVTHGNQSTIGFKGHKRGSPSVFYLEKGEYIKKITGTELDKIASLQFETTKGRRSALWGDPGTGNSFTIKPTLGRDVLLAVHGGTSNSVGIAHLIFEFGRNPEE